jgi:hypothetical protein
VSAAGTATPQLEQVPTFTVSPHECRDHATRELEGWRFAGYRCALCLRPTKANADSSEPRS